MLTAWMRFKPDTICIHAGSVIARLPASLQIKFQILQIFCVSCHVPINIHGLPIVYYVRNFVYLRAEFFASVTICAQAYIHIHMYVRTYTQVFKKH